MSSSNNAGSIKLIIGSMFAGKTSTMTTDIERALFAKKKCVVIKYEKDTRYNEVLEKMSKTEGIVTHGGVIFDKCKILVGSTLTQIFDNYHWIISEAQVIGISEGQFYTDIADMVIKWADEGKTIIIEGLSGNYKQEIFPQIARLISNADSIIHVTAVCMYCCNADAPFTVRHHTTNTDNELIGGAETYLAVCRACKKNLHATSYCL
jgi:thymidine kinase